MVGSPGPGWEEGGGKVPLQPSECEPGLAGAGVQRHRGERRKREPNRKEEAEMGVVRGRGRKSKGESRTARQCWGWDTSWGGGSHRGLASKATKGTMERVHEECGGQWEGLPGK